MRRFLPAALFCVLACAPADARPDSFADLAETLPPAVVNIAAAGADQSGGDSARTASLGSGFIIDRAGVIVTNLHVIEGAGEILVIFNDGSTAEAVLAGKDAKTDLAVLRVSAGRDLPSVRFGDSDRLRVGDWVLAIGNPYGLGGSVTAGIVSARNRNIDAGPYDSYIQTDAPVNSGNSGGPLFNMDGEVVGITSAILSPTGASAGIGFALPSSIAEPVVNQLLKYGETRRGYIGLRFAEVTPENARASGLDRPRGAFIAEVTPGGPAARAGVREGDLAVSVGGKPVADARAFARAIANAEIGAQLTLGLLRKTQALSLAVTPGRLEDAERADGTSTAARPSPDGTTRLAPLGITLSPITARLRTKHAIGPETEGAVIVRVELGGPAAAAAESGKLDIGDVVIGLDVTRVRAPEDAARALAAAQAAGQKSVMLLVARLGVMRFVALSLGPG